MNTINSTPSNDGFRVPAEFESHSRSWILFPIRPDNWRLNAKPAQQAFVNLIKAVSRFENISVGVLPSHFDYAQLLIPGNISIVKFEYDDAWIRDIGPTCVVNSEGIIRGVDWQFNSWGGLYGKWEKDNLVANRVLEMENLDRYKSELILEGGAINVDGEGTILATEESIIRLDRNPNLDKKGIERFFYQYLNAKKVIWLPKGIYLDETGGHIDNLCCFVRPSNIVLTWTDDKSDPQWEISTQAYDILKNETDAKGRPLEVHKIHQPAPMYISSDEAKGFKDTIGNNIERNVGKRLPGSYINFYLVNGGVIIPSFDDPMDIKAKESLQSILHDREVISLPAREFLLGGGGIHCVLTPIPSSQAKVK